MAVMQTRLVQPRFGRDSPDLVFNVPFPDVLMIGTQMSHFGVIRTVTGILVRREFWSGRTKIPRMRPDITVRPRDFGPGTKVFV